MASRNRAAGVSGGGGGGVFSASSERSRGANASAPQPTAQTVACTSTAAIVVPARIECSMRIVPSRQANRPSTSSVASTASVRATSPSQRGASTMSAQACTYGGWAP